MIRVPEPELMDEESQVLAYANADFSEPNNQFIEYFRQAFGMDGVEGNVLDLGCGPGEIALRFAQVYPGVAVHAVDGAGNMVEFARNRLREFPQLVGRVHFYQDRLQNLQYPRLVYSALISNSLLHHLHDPAELWRGISRLGSAGSRVLVMDLMRPQTPVQAERLVAQYAADEPEVLRRDFYNSLRAAFTLDEVRKQLRADGLDSLSCIRVSDRHLIVSGTL